MQSYFILLYVMLFVQTLLTPEITAIGHYFASHGAFNNSCRVAECMTCTTGEYRMGCANSSSGICTYCTRVPNATFTTHGWFNNSCGFACNEGYAVGPGRSCSKVSVQYTINFLASVTLINNTKESFNLTLYINTVAILAGCGQCGNSSLSPVNCGGCKMYYKVMSSIPVVYRRLLSSGSVVDVNTSIVIIDDKIMAKAAESNINSSMLNSKLVKANFGVITVGKEPTLTTSIILPQSRFVTSNIPSTTPNQLPPATTPVIIDSKTSDSNIGVVVGGAVGGVAVVVCIILLVSFYTRKGTQKVHALPHTSNSVFAYKLAGSNKLSSQLVYMRKHQNQ